MAKRKTLRLKKKRRTRRYRYKGGFNDFPNVDISKPNTVAFIKSYWESNRPMLENRYQIDTPNLLYAQIREFQMNPNHPLYDDLKRKYEEFMMAM
jgi:hypothetical protein